MDEDAGTRAASRSRRDRVIVRTAVSGAGVQVAQVGVTLVSLPIAARSLSSSEFGIYLIFTGLAPFLAFSDLGIGFAMTGRVAVASARSDIEEVRRSIGTALVATSVIAALLAACGAVSAAAVPWGDLLSAGEVRGSALRPAIVMAFVGAALAIVGTLGQRIFHAAQQGNIANRWVAAGMVAGGIATVTVGWMDLGLASFVFAASVVPAAVSLASAVVAARQVGNTSLTGLIAKVEVATISSFVAPSLWFFLIGLAGAFAYQTDTFVVANVLGADAAGVFGVVARIFGLLPLIVYPAMVQFWPTIVDAYAHDDGAWVASRLTRVLYLAAGGGGIACLVLALAMRPAIRWWLGDDLVPPHALVVAFAAWTVYTLLTFPPFAVLNGLGRFRLHAIIAVSVAVVNVPLTVYLTRAVGFEGAVYGSLISNAAFAIVPIVRVVREVTGGTRFRDSDSDSVHRGT